MLSSMSEFTIEDMRCAQEEIDLAHFSGSLFDEVAEEIVQDLRLDQFPRFCKSKWFHT